MVLVFTILLSFFYSRSGGLELQCAMKNPNVLLLQLERANEKKVGKKYIESKRRRMQ